MSRQLKELKSLMPWTWDSRLDKHPPGKSSMRDFDDANMWDESGHRRAAKPRAPSTLPPKKRPRQAVPVTPRSNTEPKAPFVPQSADSSALSSGCMCPVDSMDTPGATPVSRTTGCATTLAGLAARQCIPRSMAHLQDSEEMTASPDSQLDTATPSVWYSKGVLSSVDESHENMPPCATGQYTTTNTSTRASRVGRRALDVTLVNTPCDDAAVKAFEAKLAEVDDLPVVADDQTIAQGALSPVKLRQIVEQQPGAASPKVIDIAASPARLPGTDRQLLAPVTPATQLPGQQVVLPSGKRPENDGSKAFDDALLFLSADQPNHKDWLPSPMPIQPTALRPHLRPSRRPSLISSMKPKRNGSYEYARWDDEPLSPLSPTEAGALDDSSNQKNSSNAASIFGSIIPRSIFDKNDESATYAVGAGSAIASPRAQPVPIISLAPGLMMGTLRTCHGGVIAPDAHLMSLPHRLRFKRANKWPLVTSQLLPILPLNTAFKLPIKSLPPKERYMREYRLKTYPFSDPLEYASAQNISNLKKTADEEAGVQRGCTLIRWLDASEQKRAKLKRARKFEALLRRQRLEACD